MKLIVECLIGQKIAWGKRCLSPFLLFFTGSHRRCFGEIRDTNLK